MNSFTDHDGFVVYSNASKPLVLGVVSKSYKRKAITTYIPQNLKISLINIEDKRYYNHKGVDYKSIIRALVQNYKAKRIVQGGSTITQQLARSLSGNYKRTFTRKITEAVQAFQIEKRNSKEEILNLYFNNIYFGRNIYGLRTASLSFFGKEPFKLSHAEQLTLLTLLRGPNYYINNLDNAEMRFKFLNEILFKRKIISEKKHALNKTFNIQLQNNFLQIFNSESLIYLTKSINEAKKIINSTIDYNLQAEINSWVKKSKYPVSVVCISKDGVSAVASTFGDQHVFGFKTNVGSTLKPFIYKFLRDNGIAHYQQFSTLNENSISWNVREVTYIAKPLTLSEALFNSNNNVFINACFEIGIDCVYNYLSYCLQKEKLEFSPASILGATKSGITLYELANCYYRLFCDKKQSETTRECYDILTLIAKDRFELDISNIFLKTGTTNENKERFAIFGDENKVFAVLRGENPINDFSKEGGFINSVKSLAKNIFTRKKSYKWNN